MLFTLRKDYTLLVTLWLASVTAMATIFYYNSLSIFSCFVTISTPFAVTGYLLYVEKLKTRAFLKHIKHEIRNPLMVICGIAEILGETMQLNADSRHKELVGILASNAARIKNIVNKDSEQ